MSRVRKVNEKALSNMIAFLEDIEKHQKANIKFSSTELQVKHGVSKSAWSIIKKLGNFEPTREYALKILEILRLRFDKSTDAPINDAWIAETERFKMLFEKLIDNTSKIESVLESIKSVSISERVYIATEIAASLFQGRAIGDLPMHIVVEVCKNAVIISNELSNQLNSKQ